MAKLYFHLRDETLLEDPDGSEWPDLAAAVASAKEDVRDLISERVASNRTLTPAVMVIVDETGAEVTSVSFKEVLHELAPWLRDQG